MKKGISLIILIIAILLILTIVGIILFSNSKNEENSNSNNEYSFVMTAGDIFKIEKGIVVSGTIEQGSIKIGDKIKILRDDQKTLSATVLEIETFKQVLESAQVGQNVSILLEGIDYTDIKSGNLLVKIGQSNQLTNNKNSTSQIENNNTNSDKMDNKETIKQEETSKSDNKIDNSKETTTVSTQVVTNKNPNAFLLPIDEVLTINTKGTVICGTIERGTVKVGDKIQILGCQNEIINTSVLEIIESRKSTDSASKDDNVKIVIKDIKREDIQNAQVAVEPNSIATTKKIDVDLYVYLKEEHGRHTPFFNGYSPEFNIRNTKIRCQIELPKNIEMVMPGENISLTITFDIPVAVEIGDEFTLYENPRTVAKGTITKIY